MTTDYDLTNGYELTTQQYPTDWKTLTVMALEDMMIRAAEHALETVK